MSLSERFYSLALHAYPRDFRDDSREEVLGTIADVRDAGEKQGVLRQAVSLGYNGNRLRWLRATGGSVGQTVRQGVAWGLLLLIARQAGLGIYDLVKPLWQLWAAPSLLPHYPETALSSVEIALIVGWVAVFGLLASGRRRWGLSLLGVVLAGFVARQVMFSLGYGGPFSWPFTLNFFLPVLLPLLCSYFWPRRPVKFSLPLITAIMIAAVLIPAAQVALWNVGLAYNPWHGLAAWAIEVGACVIAAVFAILVGLSDPRWATAGAVVAFQPVVREAMAEGLGNRLSAVFILVILIPIVALLLAFRARRRAVPARN